MKPSSFVLIALTFLSHLAFSAPQIQQSRDAVKQDIKNTFGFYPTFMKSVPDAALAGAWAELKSLEFGEPTDLPLKIKNLIGIAIASQMPCKSCVFYNKTAAMRNGASVKEINEAIYMAADTRLWATFFSGKEVKNSEFNSEVDRMFQHLTDQANTPGKPQLSSKNHPLPQSNIKVVDADTAYQDINRVFGFVPEFMKAYYKNGIAPKWLVMRDFEMSSNTALSPKDKEIIALAVSTQIPCSQCIYFHKEAALSSGTIDREIQEAIETAAITRNWSTLFMANKENGHTFENEMDRGIKFFQQKMKRQIANVSR